ncbi:MAG: hypothetical protein ACK5P7_12715 [Bdellovibrio sp.]
MKRRQTLQKGVVLSGRAGQVIKGFAFLPTEQSVDPRTVFKAKFKHKIPELYHAAFPQQLLDQGDRLEEKKATCENCAMAPENRPPKAKVTYQKQLKCCTFEPYLPNFVVGALLTHEDRFQHGIKQIRRKIAKREYALPLGLLPSVKFQVQFNNRKAWEFGNREDWLCPYYVKTTQSCGIWKYRGTVCTTFFCQHDAGAAGQRFWESLSNFLSFSEMALMEDLLAELDFSPRQVSELLDYMNRIDGTAIEKSTHQMPEALFKRLWNGYDSDLEGFYKKCYEKAKGLSRPQFQEMMGSFGLTLESKMLRRLKALENSHK